MSRCMFCTDDKHLDDLLKEGSIDHNVRLAIQEGIDPIMAISMGSLNPALCYGLHTKGAIAPGYEADFFMTDSLQDLHITSVYKAGNQVASNGEFIGSMPHISFPVADSLQKTVHIEEVTEKHLELKLTTKQAHVIEIIPNSLITKKIIEEFPEQSSVFEPSLERDLLKMAVIERHHYTGNIGLGIVKGLQLKEGAIATTIAHDSHNLVVAGTNDADMILAINTLKRMQGGIVYVAKGKIQASLALSIGGLFSNRPFQEVNEELVKVKDVLKKLGFSPDFNPFLTLSFLTLPVIPELKLTDKGLFDMITFSHIPVYV